MFTRLFAFTVPAVILVAGCGAGPQVEVPVVDQTLSPRGPIIEHVPVDRVVDGDTVRVLLDGRSESVRLIGINTPETVKPNAPVECFGPEASDFAKALLTDSRVTLEFDSSQGERDRYDRLLAYVWREVPGDGLRLFNLEAVEGGYAEERQYTKDPYAWAAEFAAAQDRAQAGSEGMWGACPAS